MSEELNREVSQKRERLLQIWNQVLSQIRHATATVIAFAIVLWEGLCALWARIVPLARRASRRLKVWSGRLRQAAVASWRKLYETEKAYEPVVIEAVEGVVDTAIRTAPKAKKAVWTLGRVLFIGWLVVSLGTIGVILAFATR